jgi:pimeloyl-ACP methyl ester carboxylesterase
MAPLVYSNHFYRAQKGWLDHRAEIFHKVATKEWYESFIGLCQNFLTLQITSRLHEIKAPTLILAGGDDLLKPVYYSEILHDQIPDSELVVIAEAGHGLFLEKSKEFNEIVADFIYTQSRRRGEMIFF